MNTKQWQGIFFAVMALGSYVFLFCAGVLTPEGKVNFGFASVVLATTFLTVGFKKPSRTLAGKLAFPVFIFVSVSSAVFPLSPELGFSLRIAGSLILGLLYSFLVLATAEAAIANSRHP